MIIAPIMYGSKKTDYSIGFREEGKDRFTYYILKDGKIMCGIVNARAETCVDFLERKNKKLFQKILTK